MRLSSFTRLTKNAIEKQEDKKMRRKFDLCDEEELFEMISKTAREYIDYLDFDASSWNLVVVLKYGYVFKEYSKPFFTSYFEGRASCVSTISGLKKLTKLSNIHKKTDEEIKEDVRQELEKLSPLWKMTPEQVYTTRGEEVEKRMIRNASRGWCYNIEVFDTILEKELCKEFLKDEKFQNQLEKSFKEARLLRANQAN